VVGGEKINGHYSLFRAGDGCATDLFRRAQGLDANFLWLFLDVVVSAAREEDRGRVRLGFHPRYCIDVDSDRTAPKNPKFFHRHADYPHIVKWPDLTAIQAARRKSHKMK
jgi:hypothetical protein